MRFFVDNSISPVLTEAIRVLARIQKYEIVHLRDRFPEDARDVDWIAQLAKEGDWVIVSGDPGISNSKAEQAAWHESGLTAFFFAEGFVNRRFWKQAEIMVRWWPLIVLKAREATPGAGYVMPLSGSEFRQIYEPSGS